MAEVQLTRDEILNIFREISFDQGPGVMLRDFVEQTGIASAITRDRNTVSSVCASHRTVELPNCPGYIRTIVRI